jgi:hypothetical protein
MIVRTALPRLLLGLATVISARLLALNGYQIDPAVIEGATHNVGVWAPMVHVALFALGTILFVPGALVGLAGGMSHAIWRTVCGGKQVGSWTRPSRGLRRRAGVSSLSSDWCRSSRSISRTTRSASHMSGLSTMCWPLSSVCSPANLPTPISATPAGKPCRAGDADTESPCGSGPIGRGGFSDAASPSVARRQTT